jgi:hypothetical protein
MPKKNLHAKAPQVGDNIGNLLLRLRHSKAISRHNDNPLRVQEGINNNLSRGLLGDLGWALHLVIRRTSGRSPGTSTEHIVKGAIHCTAHNKRQDEPRGANECPCDDQQVILDSKASRNTRPAAERVEHGDDNRHISTADGVHPCDTKNSAGKSNDECQSASENPTGRHWEVVQIVASEDSLLDFVRVVTH